MITAESVIAVVFNSRSYLLTAFLFLLTFTMTATQISAQNGGAAIGSTKKPLRKPMSEKEREKRDRARFDPAANRKAQNADTIVMPMQYLGISEPLADIVRKKLPAVGKDDGMLQENEMEPLVEEPEPWINNIKKKLLPAATLQTEASTPFAPIAGANFEGPGTGLPGFILTGAPPDTTMAVGPNHIVAWVNSQFAVFNKSGTVLAGPVNGNSLFTGVGGLCETTNRGDPILQYDRLADRWLLSQFAFNVSGTTPASPYLQCFAVSTTNDPTGTYFRYSTTFSPTSPSGFNDYGKLGIWNDAYYTSFNIFGGSPAGGNTGAGLCASDRTKMLAGDPSATTLCAPIAFYGGGAAFLPADLDGTSLPADTTRGGLFMRASTVPALRYVRLKPDFAASTVTITDGFGGAAGSFVNLALPTTTRPCNGSGGTCVVQPGTANTLDTLGDRLMYRLQYRNRGGVDSLLVTQSVDPDGAGTRSSAVRWYEIRNPLGNPSDPDSSKRPFIYQNGTFDPGATGDRWMGSVAMDKFGNIMAGYSMANAPSAIKPSVALSGRSQCDTLNTLQAESVAVTGTGSQTGTLTRWGDYTTVQVDPVDDTTFWFIGQYLAADGTFNWRTRIVSYRFPTTNAVVDGDFNSPATWSNGVPSATTSGIVPVGRTLTINAPTTVCSLDVSSGSNVIMNADLTVTGALNLGTVLNTGANRLGLGCNATVSGPSPSIFVVGSVKKDFCSSGGFVYPTGTANGYSPVRTNITALAVNPSSLEIKANQGNHAGMIASNSLQRSWTLTETGDLTTDLTFNYLDPTDIIGTESSYKLYRFVGSTGNAITPVTLDTTANTISTTGISNFSDWAVGNLTPTAAPVSISGQVRSRFGPGIGNAIVALTSVNGVSQIARTNAFGYFQFDSVQAGQAYVMRVSAKQYQFAPQVVNVNDSLTNVDFVSSP